MNVGLLLRSLEHLRWEQLVYRPIRLLQSRLDRSVIASRWTTPKQLVRAPRDAALEAIAAVVKALPHLNPPLTQYESRLADIGDNRFTFLNRPLTIHPIDWNHRYESHLWNYNLHYFAYSLWCAQSHAERGDGGALAENQRLISDWIATARIGESDGWDAYPVSLRLVNWIYAYALTGKRTGEEEFHSLWSSSIYRQLDYLSRRVEYHLLANHIIKNAKALVVGGLFFGEASWLETGRALMLREFDEQVLDDGGHFERAPMYHAQVLADFLEAFSLLRAFGEVDETVFGHAATRLHKMGNFLAAMSNRDGSLALFNDSANTEECRPRPILESVAHVSGNSVDNVWSFPETGYYLWESPDLSERMVVDAGPPAAAYNTAHAHCDLLSYELWLHGHPFIIDPGVHGYEGDRFREYARSTRAHNTVVIDGREQSEIWATFRMGARATLVSAESTSADEVWRFRGAYRPYFDHRIMHERRIVRDATGEWLISDKLEGAGAHALESFIHLHPGVRARKDNSSILCEFAGCRVWIEPFGVTQFEIVSGVEEPMQGWYFRDFGIAEPSATICMRVSARQGEEFGYRIRQA
ncbi:MAG: alginate lyase family protein [Acidobacteriota bacterium]